MSQPPNNQSGQPYPQNPPLYPEVKPLPKGWQQPINLPPLEQQPQMPPPGYYQQQPQPQQYNPNGYYGGVQPPRAVKKWPWWATMILVFVVFGGILVVAAYSSRTTSTTSGQQVVATAAPAQRTTQVAATVAPALKLGRVGEVIGLNGYTLTVNSVQKSDNFDTSNNVGKAKDGNTMLAIDFTIGSNKAKGVSANGLYASVKDSQGFKYDFTVFGQKEPRIAGENDIPTGDKVRGWVTFEVPKSASGFILEYSQLFENEKIRVALG